MRLPPDYVEAIKTATREAFGPTAIVRLFGSRVDDRLRGGDIDLHVEVDPLDDERRARGVFEDALFRHIEPQKVDLLVTQRGGVPRGFERIAYRDGGSAVTDGEGEVAQAILARVDALIVALEEDADALGSLPGDMATYQKMDRFQRVASRALLKSVEQMEDQLARFFRLLPKLMLTDSAGWYAQDYANFAEKLGIVPNSFAWTAIIRLRNRLVHDYPLQPEAQLDLLSQAHAAMPLLVDTARAARSFVDKEGLLS